MSLPHFSILLALSLPTPLNIMFHKVNASSWFNPVYFVISLIICFCIFSAKSTLVPVLWTIVMRCYTSFNTSKLRVLTIHDMLPLTSVNSSAITNISSEECSWCPNIQSINFCCNVSSINCAIAAPVVLKWSWFPTASVHKSSKSNMPSIFALRNFLWLGSKLRVSRRTLSRFVSQY